jgi:peptide/nickel transport system permease protein
MGTDHMGRDLMARIAHGGMRDLGLGLMITCIAMTVGTVLGLAAGFKGGLFDSVLIVIMDLLMSVPHTIMALVLMLYLGYGAFALVCALVIPGWVKYARVVRAEAYSLRETDFIIYVKYIGLPGPTILFKHLLPNAFPPILGLAALDMGHALLSIAALGFLGFGLQPPTPEWGTMIMEARPYLMLAPWNAMFPGLFIFLYLVFFTLVSRVLQNRINPQQEKIPC